MWLLKIIAKIILKRIPVSYRIWKKIGFFKHGGMDNCEYSKHIFERHVEYMQTIYKKKNPIIMEIGPGDSIVTGICSSIYKPRKVYLIDVNSFANKDIFFYKSFIRKMKSQGIKLSIDDSDFNTFEELIDICNISYLTDGLKSFQTIKNETVDYIFSHSVLEHVRLSEVKPLIKEIYRILKSDTGLISHQINYQDHLENSLNHLRFSRAIWESKLFSSSGFYTNRITAFQMHKLFKSGGFELFNEKFNSWEKLPLSKKKLNKSFKKYSKKELMIQSSSFIAKKIDT